MSAGFPVVVEMVRRVAAGTNLDARQEMAARLLVLLLGERRLPKIVSPKHGALRAEHYLAFVRLRDCCLCRTNGPSDPHHHGSGSGVGRKVDDYRAVPLCRRCHDEHHAGSGSSRLGMDAGEMALRLTDGVVDTLVEYTRLVERVG